VRQSAGLKEHPGGWFDVVRIKRSSQLGAGGVNGATCQTVPLFGVESDPAEARIVGFSAPGDPGEFVEDLAIAICCLEGETKAGRLDSSCVCSLRCGVGRSGHCDCGRSEKRR